MCVREGERGGGGLKSQKKFELKVSGLRQTVEPSWRGIGGVRGINRGSPWEPDHIWGHSKQGLPGGDYTSLLRIGGVLAHSWVCPTRGTIVCDKGDVPAWRAHCVHETQSNGPKSVLPHVSIEAHSLFIHALS